MRGVDTQPGKLFSCMDMKDRIPEKHPLRTIRQLTDDALSSDFDELYSRVGRPGIAPEVMLMRRRDLERKVALGADKGCDAKVYPQR